MDINKIEPFYPTQEPTPQPLYENYKFSPYSMLFHSSGEARKKLEEEIWLREQKMQQNRQKQDEEHIKKIGQPVQSDTRAKNAERLKAIFVMRSLEPNKEERSLPQGKKQVSREFMT